MDKKVCKKARSIITNDFLLLIHDNYKYICTACRVTASNFKVNYEDLFSMVNERLAMAGRTHSDKTYEDFGDIKGYISTTVYSQAVNLYRVRKAKPVMNDIEEMRDIICTGATVQPDITIKETLNIVLAGVAQHLKNKPKRHMDVFREHFLNELGYEETAIAVGIPCGSVKHIIFEIRRYVQEKYGKSYKLVA